MSVQDFLALTNPIDLTLDTLLSIQAKAAYLIKQFILNKFPIGSKVKLRTKEKILIEAIILRIEESCVRVATTEGQQYSLSFLSLNKSLMKNKENPSISIVATSTKNETKNENKKRKRLKNSIDSNLEQLVKNENKIKMSEKIYSIPSKISQLNPKQVTNVIEKNFENRIQIEKDQIFNEQYNKFKKERQGKISEWESYPINDLNEHFVFLREGNYAIKWFPQGKENLSNVVKAMKERLCLPSNVNMLFACDDIIVSKSYDHSIIPYAKKIQSIFCSGYSYQTGTIIDILLPQNCITKWI